MVLNFGAGQILHLWIACFITFYVRRTPQQKQQHQCTIYSMHCLSLLSEYSGQISIQDSNTKCVPIEFEFYNRRSKIRTSFNIPNLSCFMLFVGHTESHYCKECKVYLEANGSMEEHQRSRKHINRLLQLGIELPISCVDETEDTPEGYIC